MGGGRGGSRDLYSFRVYYSKIYTYSIYSFSDLWFPVVSTSEIIPKLYFNQKVIDINLNFTPIRLLHLGWGIFSRVSRIGARGY